MKEQTNNLYILTGPAFRWMHSLRKPGDFHLFWQHVSLKLIIKFCSKFGIRQTNSLLPVLILILT